MGARHPGLQPDRVQLGLADGDVPVRLADGTFANDSLATALAPGGRLDRLLQAGATLGDGAAVTWAIDPDLVEAVADMADDNGYLVATPDGGTVPGGGGRWPSDWLERLRIATAGADVLALPYADPDLVALVHNGLQGDVATARTVGARGPGRAAPVGQPGRGHRLADQRLPRPGHPRRPRPGGVTATVLDGRALPRRSTSATRRPGGPSCRPARVGSPPCSPTRPWPTCSPGPAEAAAPVLAAQRVVAETAMITSELPSTGTARTIVAMPPRRWDPPQDFLDQLVTSARRRGRRR